MTPRSPDAWQKRLESSIARTDQAPYETEHQQGERRNAKVQVPLHPAAAKLNGHEGTDYADHEQPMKKSGG